MIKKIRRKLKEEKEEGHHISSGLALFFILATIICAFGWSRLKGVTIISSDILYPKSGNITAVIDGNTVIMQNGITVNLLGIEVPDEGRAGYQPAKDMLTLLTEGDHVYFEYDRVELTDGKDLEAYLFTSCTQVFEKYCRKGKMLINEIMVKENLAKYYPGEINLRYDKYLK